MHDIYRIQKNQDRAKSLVKAAEQRMSELAKIRNLVSESRIVEFYYDIVKELILGLMYKDGYKTLSHVSMIEYLRANYSEYFDDEHIQLIDLLRRKRNDVSYYGKLISSSFLYQKEDKIKLILSKFLNIFKE
jgi:hypothetical protein